MKGTLYKLLSLSNDARSIKNGRGLKRIHNKGVMKLARKFMK